MTFNVEVLCALLFQLFSYYVIYLLAAQATSYNRAIRRDEQYFGDSNYAIGIRAYLLGIQNLRIFYSKFLYRFLCILWFIPCGNTYNGEFLVFYCLRGS